jgi:hypothetical protein
VTSAEIRCPSIRTRCSCWARSRSPSDLPPDGLGLLPGDADEYVITGGALTGQRGFFTRGNGGAIVGIDLGGRLYKRS